MKKLLLNKKWFVGKHENLHNFPDFRSTIKCGHTFTSSFHSLCEGINLLWQFETGLEKFYSEVQKSSNLSLVGQQEENFWQSAKEGPHSSFFANLLHMLIALVNSYNSFCCSCFSFKQKLPHEFFAMFCNSLIVANDSCSLTCKAMSLCGVDKVILMWQHYPGLPFS